jgi:hypothetical protein
LINRLVDRDRAVRGRDLVVDDLELTGDPASGHGAGGEEDQRRQARPSCTAARPRVGLMRDHERSRFRKWDGELCGHAIDREQTSMRSSRAPETSFLFVYVFGVKVNNLYGCA